MTSSLMERPSTRPQLQKHYMWGLGLYKQTRGDIPNHRADTQVTNMLSALQRRKPRLREGGEGILSHKACKWQDFMQIVPRVTVTRSAEHTRPGFSLAPHTGLIWKKSKFHQTPSKPQCCPVPVNNSSLADGL